MISISLCMIVKNEQDTLERCLHSIRDIVDEVVIVDTGSTDETKEVACKVTPNVIDFEWVDDFGVARNFSFAEASMDYILWLDADDVLLEPDRQKLLQLKQNLSPQVDAVSMQYNCDFDEHGNVSLSVRRIRLVKRSRNFQWEGAVHEDLFIKSRTVFDSDIVVTHLKNGRTSDPNRNIRIYEGLLSKGRILTARDTLHYAMELHQHRFYNKAKEYYLKFLDFKGLSSEDKVQTYLKLADCCYYLGERDEERQYTYQSFDYDIPRPEACCRLGYHLLQEQNYSNAVFWYKLATELPTPSHNWAITNQVSRTWLPHMQLGQCYYHMGEYELSYHHNKIALEHLPGNQGIISNLQLLEELTTKRE